MDGFRPFKLHNKDVKEVTKWLYKNQVEQVRLRHISPYKGREKQILEDYAEDKVPPIISTDHAVQLLSILIERGLAKSYAGETKVEYFDFVYSGNQREWKSITKRREFFVYVKDGFIWCIKNTWLILLWATTSLLSTGLGKLFFR